LETAWGVVGGGIEKEEGTSTEGGGNVLSAVNSGGLFSSSGIGGGEGKIKSAAGGGGAKGGGIAKRVSPAGGVGSVPNESSDDSVDETKVSFDEGIGGGLKSSDEDGRIVLTAGLAI
jgi:hypothetical protein